MKAMRMILASMWAALLPATVAAKGEVVYTQPQAFYSNAGMVKIDKVVLADTATVVHCTAMGKINAWFQFAPSTYLSDEEAVRYPVRGAVGLELGEKCYIPKSGQVEFRLLFAPMPKDTKIFDLIEGTDNGMFLVYGIHDGKAKLRIPQAKEAVDAEETGNAMFRKGTAVVRGTIADFSPRGDAPFLTFAYTTMGQWASRPYPAGRPFTIVAADGTFSATFPLEHPVWAEMNLGNGIPGVPFYVRPGDTLDITVGGWFDHNLTVAYASSHPKGCYPKLMAQSALPIVYHDWNRLSDYGRDLDAGRFLERVDECVAENMRLSDYVAWKYKLTPWETRLLKNLQRARLTAYNLVKASQLFEAKVTPLRGRAAEKEDYAGYDYSAYKVMQLLPSDDPSLSFLPYCYGYPEGLEMTYPMVYAGSYAFFDNSSETAPMDFTQVEIDKDSLQVAMLRQFMGTEGTPWAVQAFLTESVARLQGEWTAEQRERLVNHLTENYLTYPYFKTKIEELNRLSGSSAALTYEMPEGDGRAQMEAILDRYKGSYVQVVWLSGPDADYSFCGNMSVKNIMADAARFPGLQFVAIVNGDNYASSEQVAGLNNDLPFPVVYGVDGESYRAMRQLFRFGNGPRQMTFDRNGLAFKEPLDMKSETLFRDRFRRMLKAEKDMQ